MLRRPTSCAAALAVVSLLGACGAPPPTDSGPYQVSGVYVDDPTLLPIAIAVLAVDPGVVPLAAGADGPVAAAAVEFAPGYYVVASGFIGLNGDLELTFVEADEIPGQVLVPATEAFVGGWGSTLPAGCSVVASDSAARTLAFGLGAPFLVPVNFGFTTAGNVFPYFVTAALGPNPSSATFIEYVFADRPVALTSAGTCADGDQDLTVDVDLASGWNRVTVRLTGLGASPVAVTVADDDGTLLRVQLTF